ncbi:hypothetical protein CHS0354_019944 [Potamilus streckersoni]|uniref:Uncharacterized protein n=1 Tax=Potamilus streckersoni TaxID=2493646 RepID=A0AAE0S045_9BIVA|nr:hypothetical protein CHS0354_019944 [Potamilus streckersoni]
MKQQQLLLSQKYNQQTQVQESKTTKSTTTGNQSSIAEMETEQEREVKRSKRREEKERRERKNKVSFKTSVQKITLNLSTFLVAIVEMRGSRLGNKNEQYSSFGD